MLRVELTKKMPWGKKGNQPDKTQSQKIPKPHSYDVFPTARAAFIGMQIFKLARKAKFAQLHASTGLNAGQRVSLPSYCPWATGLAFSGQF